MKYTFKLFNLLKKKVCVLSQNAHAAMGTSIASNLIVRLLHRAKHLLTQ